MSIEENFKSLISSLKLEVAVIKSFNTEKSPPTMNVLLNLPNGDSDEFEIYMPLQAGSGGAGVFYTPEIGTRVICGRLPDTSEQFYAITYIPSLSSSINNVSATASNVPAPHTPHDAVSYPILKKATMKVQNSYGYGLKAHASGVDFTTSLNRGIKLYLDRLKTNYFSSINHSVTHTDGGDFVSGTVRRDKDSGLGVKSITSPTPEGNSHTKIPSVDRGIFSESKVKTSYVNGISKNFGRTEFRADIRWADKRFKGYTKTEEESTSKDSAILTADEKIKISQAEDINNILHLSPGKLIQIIAGNVVSGKGEVLDSNFEGIRFGKTPKAEKKIQYKTASELESRAIGMLLQLDTSFESEGISNNVDNFIMSIEKSGFLFINVPKTKDTGSVFKRKKVSFYDGLGGRVSSSNINYEEEEDIPIVSWYEGSSYPSKVLSVSGKRRTGLYYKNIGQYSLEESNSAFENIHITGYHNMSAACESLYGNYPTNIFVPELAVTLNNNPKDAPSVFEVPELTKRISLNKDKKLPSVYSSLLEVSRVMPAVRPGGATDVLSPIYCGRSMTSIGPYSNNFKIVKGEEKTSSDEKYKAKFENENETIRTGGKSANLNFAGSIECSIGKDNADGKSIVLDTEGEMVAWLGAGNKVDPKTKIKRSASIQTDGSVAINIGGSRISNKDLKEFTKGRLDIRVNVVDKGTLNSPNETTESDYIISIGPHGLVISGGQENKPMLIRNKGDLLLESSHGQIKMSSSSKILYKTSSNPYREIGSAQYSRNARDNIDEILSDDEG